MAFERVGVRVSLEGVARFTRDAERVRRDISGMGRTARGLTAPFRLAGTAISKFAGFLGRVATIAGGIIAARIFMGITRGLSMIAGEALRAAAEFQKLEIRFEGLIARELAHADATLTMAEALKMAQEPAQELLEWIKKIAVTTPFTVESLANAISMSQAMGFNVEKSKELTMAIGNFTAGMGLTDEAMERIIYNFGQMIQQGKVTGTELRDLARGSLVPVTDVLHLMQEQLGDTRPWEEFREAAAKGKVPVEAFFEAFITIANRDFPGAMERMSMTWQGVTSNIKDFIQAVLGVDLLGPVVDRFTRRAAEWLQRMMTPEMRRGMREIGETLGESFDKIMGVLNDELIPSFKEFFAVLGLGDMSVQSFIDLIERAVDGIINFITTISGWVTTVTTALENVKAWIDTDGAEMFEPFRRGAEKALAFIQEEVLPVFETEIQEFLDWAKEEIPIQIEGIGTNLEKALDALTLLWEQHGEGLTEDLDQTLAVLSMAYIGGFEVLTGIVAGLLEGLAGDWEAGWQTIEDSFNIWLEGILSIADTNLKEFVEVWSFNLDALGLIVRTKFYEVIEFIEGLIADFFQLGVDIIIGMVDGISSVVHDLYDLVDKVIEEVISTVKRVLGIDSASKVFQGIGKSIVEGMKGGVKSKISGFLRQVRSLAEEALRIIRSLLGIDSPSKEFERVGREMMEGLSKGIMDLVQLPELAVSIAASRAIAPAMAASPISRTVNTTYNYAMHINTRAPVEPIIADFRTLQSMAGAI